MIPVNDMAVASEEPRRQPDLTWKIENGRMCGMVDGLEAVRQAAVKRLDTEAGIYDIYSESYGLKTLDLLGKELDYAIGILRHRIVETLLWDERVTDVGEFQQTTEGRKVRIRFTVSCIHGRFDLEKNITL